MTPTAPTPFPSALPAPSLHQPEPERTPGASLLELVNVLLRYRRTILLVAVALPVLALLDTVRRPVTYTSSATFIPQQGRAGAASSLSSLAAQFGVAVGGTDPMQNSNFYADLVRSREVLQQAAAATYTVPRGEGRVTGTIYQLYNINSGSEAQRAHRAAGLVRAMVSATPALKTGVITLNVTASSPELANQVNTQILAQVNRFNLERRQSQAEAERVFTERRLGEVRAELREAEDRVQAFLQRNREFRGDPALSFEYDRLNRDVTQRQQVVAALTQAHEQAKIERVRDTPVLTIIEKPSMPVAPNSRRGSLKVILALFVGLVLGVAVALTREYFARTHGHGTSPERAEFEALRRAALADAALPLKVLLRRGRS